MRDTGERQTDTEREREGVQTGWKHLLCHASKAKPLSLSWASQRELEEQFPAPRPPKRQIPKKEKAQQLDKRAHCTQLLSSNPAMSSPRSWAFCSAIMTEAKQT